jgi:predicted membrane protein
MSRYEVQGNRRFNRHHRPHNPRDRSIFGIGLVLVGIALLCKTLGLFYFSYVTMWPFILIIIGLLIGFRSSFRSPASWALLIIGAANLTPQFTILGHPSSALIWPMILICGGILIALRSRRAPSFSRKGGIVVDTVTTAENTINIDVTFGGRKEYITSKDFKGGSIFATFGGCEVNLMQADTTERIMVIDMKISFGGVELIVPSHWVIQNEISPAFGSVEDERMLQPAVSAGEQKVLLLKGTCSFGSIEIKSF